MQKSWSWSTTGYGFPKRTHEEIIEICRHSGLGGIEGAAEVFGDVGEGELEAIAGQYRDAGLRIDTFHLPFGAEDDIASFYESVRLAAVDKAKRWMERAAILGARAGIQHPTTSRYNADIEGLDNYLRQLGKSLSALLPLAEELNFTIALENLPYGDVEGRLSSRPEHFARFIDEFAHANLGFCLDTGHALIAAGPERADEFFEIMAPHMAAFHLSDTPGDRDLHLAPGNGLVDWGKVFKRAAEIGYAHSMCIETAPFAHGPNHTFSADAWKRMVEETEALAEKILAG